MMREMSTPGQPCGLKVRLGNLKTGTLKCALKLLADKTCASGAIFRKNVALNWKISPVSPAVNDIGCLVLLIIN